MKINEAIILLGGMGTRLLPLTKTIPKEMLPVYNVPSIYLTVKEAYESGIRKIIFVVTKHNKKIIENFFSKDKYLDNFLMDKPDKLEKLNDIYNIINKMEFKYVYQNLKGTFGALYSAKNFIKNDNFIVMYGDEIFTNSPTKKLIKEYSKNKKMQVLIKKEDYDNLPNVGVVQIDSDKNLINLVPKKEIAEGFTLHGRMLLNKEIFKQKNNLFKHDNDEYYLSYALLKCQENVKTVLLDGEYFNIGEKTGFIKASIYYAMKDNNEKEELIKFINKMKGE